MSKKKNIKKPRRSKKFAWFLGALAGDGYVNIKGGSLVLSVTQKDFAERFKSVGEELFQINSSWYHRELDNPNHSDVYTSSFFSKELSNWIGDFRGGVWHKTIMEKYSWVVTEDKYKISFLNGYFDSEGSVENVKETKTISRIRCRISVGYWEPAFFLKELLESLGVKNTFYIRPSTGIVHDICIFGADNVIKFCNMITPSVDYKRERAKYISKIIKVDNSVFIENLYQRYKELIEECGCAKTYSILLEEGYGDNNHYKLTKNKIRNWTYLNHNPTNKRGNHHVTYILP